MCCELNVCVLPKSICWPNPQWDGIWMGGVKVGDNWVWMRSCRWTPLGWDWCPYQGMKRSELSLFTSEETKGRQLSVNQEDGPIQEPDHWGGWVAQ